MNKVMNATVQIKCRMCGQHHAVRVDQADYIAYTEEAHVQHAFPYLTADQRELFISQTCGSCWDNMFGDEEDDCAYTKDCMCTKCVDWSVMN